MFGHAEASQPEPAVSLDLPLQASTEIQPVLEHASQLEPAVSLDLPLQTSAESQSMFGHAEASQPEPAMSLDLPLQASTESQPVLEHASQLEPAISLDLPLQTSAESQSMFGHAEASQPEPAVSPDLPLQASTESQPVLEHASQLEPAVSLDLPLQTSAESQSMLGHAEASQPETAVSLDLPLQASTESQPVLEHASQLEPAVSLDLPLQTSAESQSMFGHAEASQPEPAVSPDLPLRASVEVQLEHAERPQSEPVGSGNVHTAQMHYDHSIANHNGAIGLDPKFVVTDEVIQASNSGKHVKLGRLANASEKNEAALTPKEEGAPEHKSAAKEARSFKGSIGVTVRRVTEGVAHALNVKPARGALVAGIDENGPAEAAGIELNDVIVRVDGKDVKECRDLPRIVADTPAGKDLAVTIIRKGKELMQTIKVGQLEDTDEQGPFILQKWVVPQEKLAAVNLKSEAAARHLPVIGELQQQPVSSAPLFVVPPAPHRFGKRPIDHFSKVRH